MYSPSFKVSSLNGPLPTGFCQKISALKFSGMTFSRQCFGRIAHWEKMATGMLNRFESADNGNVEKMTAWNLYNAIQGTFQHDARNTANKNFSILCGGIAGKSREALDNVYDLVEHGFSKTSSTAFDRAFAKLA